MNILIMLSMLAQVTSLLWAAPSRSDMDPAIISAAQMALERDAQRLALDPALYYAVMDIQTDGNLNWVSMVGVPQATNWRFEDATWTGTAIVYWSDQYNQYISAMDDSPVAPQALMGDKGPQAMAAQQAPTAPDAGYIFPWAEGTTMFFGPRGVHTVGYSQDPTKVMAVDFVSGSDFGGNAAPDTVYAVSDGTIIATCKDNTSLAIVVDSYGSRFVYAHLQIDSSLTRGRELQQGEPFGVLVHGTFDDSCGYADQEPDHYHLHFGMPADTGKWRLEDCMLNFDANSWDCNGNNITPGEWFPTAEGNPWTGDGGKNTGSNFWDHILKGWVGMVTAVFEGMPDHQATNIVSNVVMNANFILKITYVLLLTNFRMALPMTLFGLVMVLEAGRMIYTGYMLIKRAIPFAG